MADLSNDNLSHLAKRSIRAPKNDIPVQYLHECFSLDPTIPSGLRWRQRPRSHFGDERVWAMWNTRRAGKEAGTPNGEGYLKVTLTFGERKRQWLAHRVTFALAYGRWPNDQLDHQNRNTAVNKIENLREATNGQNQQNTRLRSNNTSGFKGVRWDKRDRKWRAQIAVEGRRIHLGFFDDILDAIMTRQQAERERHPFHARPRLDADIIALPLDLPVEVIEAWKLGVDRGLWRLPPRIHFKPRMAP